MAGRLKIKGEGGGGRDFQGRRAGLIKALASAALLTVSDDEFWKGVSPVGFGKLPTLQDVPTVVGYPIGGDTISVTSGVVYRIEILSYVHDAEQMRVVKEALLVSTPPSDVVCREEELEKVLNFCKSSVETEKSGSLYVCGCPGTGKTMVMEKSSKLSRQKGIKSERRRLRQGI